MAPEVTVLGTGGTIASTAGEGGATPGLSAAALLEAVPEIEEHATLSVEQVAQVPSFDMDFGTVEDVADAVRAAADSGVDGVVVTHGTDTMEETAYYLDLTLATDVPVVVTGAQRRPDEVSPDGPANLLTAVRAAAHERFRDAGGVYVAFDESVHAARHVTKVHTSRLDAFESPEAGPVTVLDRTGPRWFRTPGSRSASLPAGPPTGDVPTVATGIGVDGGQVERAVEAGADGVVLAATGLGNATAALGEAVAGALESSVPVVVASRCLAGTTAPVYGTPGGGETLVDRGALTAGDLPPQKARIKLLLALAADADPGAYFGPGGDRSPSP